MAKVPFSDDTAILLLDKLKDPEFVQSLVDELRKVFKVSCKRIVSELSYNQTSPSRSSDLCIEMYKQPLK